MELEHYLSAIISIATGILLAASIELILFAKHRIKRRSEIGYIRQFFQECVTEIRQAQDTEDGRVQKNVIQFTLHKYQLRSAGLIVAIRSSHLSNTQHFEVMKLINDRVALVECFCIVSERLCSGRKVLRSIFRQAKGDNMAEALNP